MLPAAFCPHSGGVLSGPADSVPLVSVGALNPDGSVALFSNGGPWVACHGPGAALVSTLPEVDVGTAIRGRPQRRSEPARSATWRATIDPDSFTGFGSWSGTSFAAPVMAASAAQALLEPSCRLAGRGGPGGRRRTVGPGAR